MERYDRGGRVITCGEIGRFHVLRQQFMLPGETIHQKIRGSFQLSPTVQRANVHLNAHLACYAAPVRWFWDQWTDFVQEGISTALTIPTLTGTQWTASRQRTTNLGLGHLTHDFCKWYAQMPIQVWNEWYRWHETAREDVDSPDPTFFDDLGKPCVNLSAASSRIRQTPTIDALESDIPSATTVDVRDIATYQARYQQAAVTEWTSESRYKAFLKDIYNASGTNEVDKVPIQLMGTANLGVTPREMYATDGPSLGEQTTLNNFNVENDWEPFTCPEHMLLCTVAVLRFEPILEDGVAPLVYPAHHSKNDYQGDPEQFMIEPQDVRSRQIDGNGDATVIGKLPAGWAHRERWNHVANRIAAQGTYPLLDNQPTTADGYRDPTKINDAIFANQQLLHWQSELNFDCDVLSHVPPAGQSIVAGSNRRGPRGIHPTGPLK